MERENLGPARDAIHDLFLEHVMAHAPGYNKLMEWTDALANGIGVMLGLALLLSPVGGFLAWFDRKLSDGLDSGGPQG